MSDKKKPIQEAIDPSQFPPPSPPGTSIYPTLSTTDSELLQSEPVGNVSVKHVRILEDPKTTDDAESPSKENNTIEAMASKDLLAKILASRRASRVMRVMDFRLNWEEFVRTVKVHEMLKCLEAEHRKLKILRQHAEDVLVQEAELKKDKETEQSRLRKRGSQDTLTEDDFEEGTTDPDDKGLDDIETENERVKKKKKLQHKDSDHKIESKSIHSEGRSGSGMESTENLTEADVDLAREQEKEDKITRNRNITDEEFEEIVALCADRSEQKALRETFAEKRNRDKYLHNASERRKMTYDFINSKFFKNFMLVTIIISTTGITLLTFEQISTHYLFPIMMLDACVMGVFVVEAALKISIYKEDYFKRMWNLLDMIIVVVHFTEITVDLVTKTLALSADINSKIAFKFLKSLRALRLLRIIKFLPSLQVIVSTIFQSFLSLGSIAVLMCLFIFVFAVMGKGLFAEDVPIFYGNLWISVVTLFTMLTLDDWSDQLLQVEKKKEQYWMLFFYLFLYILIEYFVFLNLFVAVLVDNFQLSLEDAEVRQQTEAGKYEEGKLKMEDTTTMEDRNQYQNQRNIVGQQILAGTVKTGEGDEGKDGIDGNVNIIGVDEIMLGQLPGDTVIQPLLVETKMDTKPKYELPVEEYYGIPVGSKEANFMQSALKNMTAVDFQRLIWKRRLTVLNNILDEATLTRANTYLKGKKQEQEAEEIEESADEDEDEYMRELRRETLVTAASVHQLY